MAAPSIQPYLNRLMTMRCRLTYAQQRVRELEALLADHGVAIPEGVTEVLVPAHRPWTA